VKLVGLEEIQAALAPEAILDAVRRAFVAHAEGGTIVPPPIHLLFPEADGDAHVKAGMLRGGATFTVKLATGFPRNVDRGLPTGGGLLVVASAQTGEVLAVLDDRGSLTAARTAAAGALATDALAPAGPLTLGVIGTGVQASLAAPWLRHLRTVERVLFAGRRAEAVEALAAQTPGGEASSIAELLEQADAIVTTTASTVPLFEAGDARRPELHVTALGADIHGKQELPAELFRGAFVVVDDRAQTLDHGDLSHAVAAGAADPDAAIELGVLLRDRPPRPPGTTIADLTGVGALDAAVADAVLVALGATR
jgi:ornithine cyclodeaminase